MLEQVDPDKFDSILKQFPERIYEEPGFDETHYHDDNRNSVRSSGNSMTHSTLTESGDEYPEVNDFPVSVLPKR